MRTYEELIEILKKERAGSHWLINFPIADLDEKTMDNDRLFDHFVLNLDYFFDPKVEISNHDRTIGLEILGHYARELKRRSLLSEKEYEIVKRKIRTYFKK